MIYNIHHFYYWSRGGVETGEAYRAKIFRELGLEAKFIFATPFPNQVFQHEMSRLGFLDSEVEWMYGSFTDCKVSPVTYTLDMFLKSLEGQPYTLVRQGVSVKIYIDGTSTRYVAELTNETDNYVRRILLLSRECILRIDHYTYCRIYSEFYAPKDGQAQFYLRRFYNENGSTAYEELVNGENILYRFPDRILYSREELVGYMMSRLHLTADDVVLIDGEPGNIEMSAFIDNAYPARVGLFLHADHCMAQDGDHVRWYYIYEYAFAHPEKISFFMTNTDAQTRELKEQFKKYRGVSPTVLTIPASGIQELIVPKAARKSIR